jgi:hypothetical protein
MRPARTASVVVLVLAAAMLVGRPAAADPASKLARPHWSRLALQEPPPAPYVPPGANLTPTGAPVESPRPVTKRWWFWAAVGGLVVATVAVIVIAGSSDSPPGSVLGNMEVFGGR